MLERISKLKGIHVMTKLEQSNIKGSELINCTLNQMEYRGKLWQVMECYNTETGEFESHTVFGSIECPY